MGRGLGLVATTRLGGRYKAGYWQILTLVSDAEGLASSI